MKDWTNLTSKYILFESSKSFLTMHAMIITDTTPQYIEYNVTVNELYFVQ